MITIWEGLKEAIAIIFSGDQEVYGIILSTIKVSGLALLISGCIGVPLGFIIGVNRFFGKRAVVALVNTGMSIPPIAVGLFLALILWRSGPLGFLDMIYTPTAMIISQVIIAAPIIIGVTLTYTQQISPTLIMQGKALGANKVQFFLLMMREMKKGLLLAFSASFGRAISEVGAVMIVGGNIEGRTRVLTTATLQMVRVGRFDTAIALVIILLFFSFIINIIISAVTYKERLPWMTRS